VYRHDLEGFVWILAWVFFQYQDRQYTPHRLIKNWEAGGVHRVHSFKIDFFIKVGSLRSRHTPRESWQEQWPLVPYMMYTLRRLHLFRQELAYDLDPGNDEPSLERWIQFPDTKELTTIQLEYLVVWKNIARSLPPEIVKQCKEDVGLELDIHNDMMLEQSYLALFARPHSLWKATQAKKAHAVLTGSEEKTEGKPKAVQ
jgi:hypothetical protein